MSIEGWKSKAVHTIPLPSGFEVKVRLPNVSKMVMGAEFPNALREVALRELQGLDRGELTMEQLEAAVEFGNYVVVAMVLEPVLSKDDLDELPQEDVEALAALAKREVSIKDYLAHWNTGDATPDVAPEA
jgi:hypothetical protein